MMFSDYPYIYFIAASGCEIDNLFLKYNYNGNSKFEKEKYKTINLSYCYSY